MMKSWIMILLILFVAASPAMAAKESCPNQDLTATGGTLGGDLEGGKIFTGYPAVDGLSLEFYWHATESKCSDYTNDTQDQCLLLNEFQCFTSPVNVNSESCKSLNAFSPKIYPRVPKYFQDEDLSAEGRALLVDFVTANFDCVTVEQGGCNKPVPTGKEQILNYVKNHTKCVSVVVDMSRAECKSLTVPPNADDSKKCEVSIKNNIDAQRFCNQIRDGYDDDVATKLGVEDILAEQIAVIRGYRASASTSRQDGYNDCKGYIKNYATKKYGTFGTDRWSVEAYNALWGCKIMFNANPETEYDGLTDDFKALFDAWNNKSDCSKINDTDVKKLCAGGVLVTPFYKCEELDCCLEGWKSMQCPAGDAIDPETNQKITDCSAYTSCS